MYVAALQSSRTVFSGFLFINSVNKQEHYDIGRNHTF